MTVPVIEQGQQAGQPTLGTPRPLSRELTTELHESVATATPDGEQVIFARNAGTHKSERTNFLFSSLRGSLDYQTPQPLPFNDKKFNNLHPSLCPQGYRLIFSSDRPGGEGGFDLYYAERTYDGGWGPATNMGSTVNSAADEVFPFWGSDGLIAFSSNRSAGLGSLDMYVLQVDGASWSAPLHLPAPFNSTANDHGLSFGESSTQAYFSSDRKGGQGGDDLYQFPLAALRDMVQLEPTAQPRSRGMRRGAYGTYDTKHPGAAPRVDTLGSSHFKLLIVDEQLGAPIPGVRLRGSSPEAKFVTDAAGFVYLPVPNAHNGTMSLTLDKAGTAPTEVRIDSLRAPSTATMRWDRLPDTITLLGHFSSDEAALFSLADELFVETQSLIQRVASSLQPQSLHVQLLGGLGTDNSERAMQLINLLELQCQQACATLPVKVEFETRSGADAQQADGRIRFRSRLVMINNATTSASLTE